MVIRYFDHEFGGQRLPLGRALRAPATGPAWRSSREPGCFDQGLEFFREGLAVPLWNVGGEADVMQKSRVVVEPEQQGSDHLPVARIAKPADDAIGAADALDFHH